MKLFLFLVFALTVLAREDRLSNVLVEERLAGEERVGHNKDYYKKHNISKGTCKYIKGYKCCCNDYKTYCGSSPGCTSGKYYSGCYLIHTHDYYKGHFKSKCITTSKTTSKTTSNISKACEDTLPEGFGVFGDIRSGGQNEVGTKSLGKLLAATNTMNYIFQYKYVVGYCHNPSQFQKGDGPTLSISVGGQQVWSYTIDLTSDDYPWDAQCGGYPTNYSPWVQAALSIPANLGGEVILSMAANDRNIHIVGNGFICAPATEAEDLLAEILEMMI